MAMKQKKVVMLGMLLVSTVMQASDLKHIPYSEEAKQVITEEYATDFKVNSQRKLAASEPKVIQRSHHPISKKSSDDLFRKVIGKK